MTLFRKNKGKGDLQQEFQATVRFLDDSEPILLPFTKDTLGQYVFDKVCDTLNLVEKDYFGLRYVDADKQRHWLDPTKTVYKQLKGVSPCVLCFRVKFYPSDPMKLHEEITRYYLFLQLRRDLHHGRLLCSPADANLLASYIIQSELGDYDPQDHPPGYVAEFKMLPSQNVQQEQQIHEIHKTLTGQVPAEAEANFLKKASSLDTFGVDPHKVKDQKGTQMYLGVTHQGIMTFHGSRRTQIYKWSQIKKLAFEGKTFIVHVNINETTEQGKAKGKKHQPIGYKCLTVPACKYLWRCAVEQQFFFTLQNSFHSPKVRSGGSLFSRGSKFRFSGRCQNEAFIASEEIKRQEPQFQRTCSLPNFTRKSDNRLHMRNSANMSESITEDKGGKPYKADTLPRMTTIPTVSAEPSRIIKAPPVSGVQKVSTNDGDKKPEPNTVDNKAKRQSSIEDATKPKLVEIARHSSKEVFRYTEVEQKQTVFENKPPVVAEAKIEVTSVATPVEVVAPLPEVIHKESAVDVPKVSAQVLQRGGMGAPLAAGEDTIITDEITPVHTSVVASAPPSAKQNGGIPIIVTSAYESTKEDTSLLYDPDETLFDKEEDAKAAKSLEEQVLELEKEFESMKDKNHTDNVVDEKMDVAQSSKTESSPAAKAPVAAPKKGGCSCGKVLAFTFFSVIVTLTVTACVVMFSDIEHPVMNELRNHLTFLEPGRDFIIDRYNSLFSK